MVQDVYENMYHENVPRFKVMIVAQSHRLYCLVYSVVPIAESDILNHPWAYWYQSPRSGNSRPSTPDFQEHFLLPLKE